MMKARVGSFCVLTLLAVSLTTCLEPPQARDFQATAVRGENSFGAEAQPVSRPANQLRETRPDTSNNLDISSALIALQRSEAAWLNAIRAYPNGISAKARLQALEKMKPGPQMPGPLTDPARPHAQIASAWFPIGPAPATGGQTYGGEGCRVDVSGRATVIAPNPQNPDEVWLGTAAGGVWHSTNGGSSWLPLSDDQASLATGAIALYAGFMGRGVFRGTRNPGDGTITWCPLNPGIPLPAGCSATVGLPDPTTTTFDHVEVSIHTPNPAIMYAMFGHCPNPLLQNCRPSIYKTTDGGNTWVQTLAGSVGHSGSGSCPHVYSRYTHVLTIHPTDPETVFLGGLKLCKSTDSGQTFSETGSCTIHPDHQAVVFPDPANPNRMYDANDGGFAFSTDGGASWKSGSGGLQITGFQSVSVSPLTDRVIGGSQDNGTNMWLGHPYIWEHRGDGDSASTLIDLKNALTMYDIEHDLRPRRSTNGGKCCWWDSITNGLDTSEDSAFYPQMIQDPTPFDGGCDVCPDYHRLLLGSNRLYQSVLGPGDNTPAWRPGDSWEPISCSLGGTETQFPDIRRGNVITAIAVAPSNSNRIYLGYYDGQLFVTDGACVDVDCSNPSCWTAIGGPATGLPSATVTWLEVHPTDPDIAYASFSGFNLPGCAHVYKTTNGGGTWSPASGPNPCDPADTDSLPDIPANTISLEPSAPDNLWLGTDIGVFVSTTGGATWIPFNGSGKFSLPNVPVYEIAIDEAHSRVVAATHGRGAFVHDPSQVLGINFYEVACKPPCGLDLFFFADRVTNPPVACTIDLIQADGTIFASGQLDAQGGLMTADPNGYLVSSQTDFYANRPGAWACSNGSCLGGVDITAFNQPANPITTAAVTCGSQSGTAQILGASSQANPPSNTLSLAGLQALGPRSAPPTASAPTDAAFELMVSLQLGGGAVQTLCQVNVPLQAGDTPETALIRAQEALNAEPACAANTVVASVPGILEPDGSPVEDRTADDPRLALAAPGLTGIQLITALHVDPGDATGLFFDLDGLGVPLHNTLMPMRIDFETLATGASGGEITVVERSPLGTCAVTTQTNLGDTAADIAAAVVDAFQARGIPGPHPDCPTESNPRDATLDGSALTLALAAQVVVNIEDTGVGFTIAPDDRFMPTNRLYLPVVQKD